MSNIIDTKVNKTLFVSAVFLGVLLGFFGLLFGNDAIPEPNLLEYKVQVEKEKVSTCRLAKWIEEGRRSFFLVGFRHPEDFKSKTRIKTSSCVDESRLNDIKWLRMRFPNLKMPLIVFGENSAKSMYAAAKMRYFGYNAYMLEGGYNKFVRDFITMPEKTSKFCIDKNINFSLRKAKYLYFSGTDKNLGKRKKSNCDTVPKGLKKRISFSVEGC